MKSRVLAEPKFKIGDIIIYNNMIYYIKSINKFEEYECYQIFYPDYMIGYLISLSYFTQMNLYTDFFEVDDV